MTRLSFITSTLGGDIADYKNLISNANQSKCVDSLEFILVVQQNELKASEYEDIKDEFPNVNIKIKRQNKKGLSSGRNYGISNATGDYLFFFDDDCWITTSDFDLIHSKICKYHPDVCFINYKNNGDTKLENKNSTYLFKTSKLSDLYGKPSITISIRRSLVKDVKGFNENIGLGTSIPSGEETTLLFDVLLSSGTLEVLSVPKVTVFHHLLLEDLVNKTKFYGYGKGDGYLIRKYYKYDRALLLIFFKSLFKDLVKAIIATVVDVKKFRLNVGKFMGRLDGFFKKVY